MFTIRKHHIRALENVAKARFEDEMLEHLKNYAPKLYEIRGEQCFRKVINLGLSKSEDYELTNRGPVRFFLESMVSLGCDFDTDPQLPQAGEILSGIKTKNQATRSNNLYLYVTNHLRRCMGIKNEHLVSALSRITSNNHPYQWEKMLENDYSNSCLKFIFYLWPEKASHTGNTKLRTLITTGSMHADTNNIHTPKGSFIITVLMFMLGHGAINDPLYYWIKESLITQKNDNLF